MSSAPHLRWTAGVRREILPNGLTLLVQRDPYSPAVAVVSWIKAGFFDEPDDLVGVSHVLEHMYFKGSSPSGKGPGLGPGELARETKAAGGYLNAHTSYDHTAYYVVLPPAGLRRAVEIQSTALRGALIDPGELERELQVIIEEAKRKLDSPGAVAQETLHEVLFDHHRIRRWRIGTEEQLRSYGRDDIAAYYASRYLPERTIVAIVGNVDPEEALALGREHYGDWAHRESAIGEGPAEPARRGIRVRTLRGDVSQAELVVGWRAPAALHPDETPLAMAAATLSAGRGGWLYQSLRERGIVSSIGASHQAPQEVGVFSIGAELAPDRVPEALAGIASAVDLLARRGPTPDDLTRVRALLRQRWARRMESVDGRAMALASAEALGDISLLEREYSELGTTSAHEVRAAAERWLSPGDTGAVAYLPEFAGAELSTDSLGRTFIPGHNGRPRAASGAPELIVLDHSDILLWHKPGVPLVSLGIYVPRTSFDPPVHAGLAALASRSMARGAGELDAVQLATAFERLGGVLSSSATADWAGVSVTVEAGAIADAARLLAQVAFQPTFADAAVETERALVAEDQAQLTDDMFRYPFQLAYGEAFGDRAYGLPSLGTPDTLATFGAHEVRRWHRSVYGDARPLLVAVGDVDAGAASDALESAAEPFTTDGRRGDARDARSVELRAEMMLGGHRVVTRDRKQTALAMVFDGPARRSSDRWAAEVWAAVAGGLGGRLFEALRDRRSLAYTVLAASLQRRHAGALVTYIATSPEREDEAREQLLLELGVFAREPVSLQEHERAVNYLAGQALVSRQSTSAMLGELVDAWLLGGSLDDIERPDAGYRRVSREDVLRVATSFGDGLRSEGVVRGKS
jgi:zinc protease